MMSRYVFAVACCVLALLASGCSPDAASVDGHGQMPISRGSTGRTGAQPGPAPEGGSTLKWRYRAGFGLSDAILVDGNVVFGERTGVRAIGAALGTEKWLYETGSPAATPLYANGLVIAGTASGSVVAIDAVSGELRWRVETGKVIKASPVEYNGAIVVSGGEVSSQASSVFAFDAASGELMWEFTVPLSSGANDVIAAPLAADEGLIFAGTLSGHVYAIDAADGRLRWVFDVPGGGTIVAPPATADGSLYVSVLVADDLNDRLFALDAETGREAWRFTPGGGNSAPAVTDAGVVIVGADDGYLYALDGRSGALQWYSSTGSFATSAPVIAGDVVFAIDTLGNLCAIDLVTGTLRWQTEVGKAPLASPAVVDGGLFVRTNEGLVAVD